MATFARAQTRSYLQRFLEERRRASRSLADPDAVHDLRVSIRRLSQCLRTFRHLFEPDSAKNMRRRLRKVMDLCAAVRDCDIALEVLQEAGVDSPSAPRMVAMRADAEAALRDHLAKGRRWTKSRWPAICRARPQSGSPWAFKRGVEENIRNVLPGLIDDFQIAGNAAATASDGDALHEFRLRAKRVRYTLEIFRKYYGAPYDNCMRALRQLQNRLGAINDCASTIRLVPDDPAAISAVRRLQDRREAEYRAFWKSCFTARRIRSWKKGLSRPKV